jgi:hypothetical protein
MEVRMNVRRALVLLALMIGAPAAQAADLPGPIVIKGPIQTTDPCADPEVLRGITDRFAWAETRTWHRGFIMASLMNPRSSNHAFYEPGIIPRHYCMADSQMTDGAGRTVYYTIEIGQGFASIGNTVDFCVIGLDPWHVHDEACRTVR